MILNLQYFTQMGKNGLQVSSTVYKKVYIIRNGKLFGNKRDFVKSLYIISRILLKSILLTLHTPSETIITN